MGLAKQFEDLEIWREARILATAVYGAFRTCKDYGFRDQMQRSAVSVMNNIAEGFERRSKADFARFLGMAKGSCGEARSMLYLACDIGYIEQDRAKDLIARFGLLGRRIGALTQKLKVG